MSQNYDRILAQNQPWFGRLFSSWLYLLWPGSINTSSLACLTCELIQGRRHVLSHACCIDTVPDESIIMINNHERTTFQLEPVPMSCASYLFLPMLPWVPWKLAATYPCRTETLTGLMVQYKAGRSGNSDIGMQSVNWFVHFSAACSSNGTDACVQQRQVLDPHSIDFCFHSS